MKRGGLVATPIVDLLSLLTVALLAVGYREMFKARARGGDATAGSAPRTSDELRAAWTALAADAAPLVDAPATVRIEEAATLHAQLLASVRAALDRIAILLHRLESECVRAVELSRLLGEQEGARVAAKREADRMRNRALLVQQELEELCRRFLGVQLDVSALGDGDLERLRANARERLATLEQQLNKLRAELVGRELALAAGAASAKEIDAMRRHLAGHDADIVALESERDALRQRFLIVERHIESGDVPITPGAPVVNEVGEAKSFVDLMLVHEKVWPIMAPYFQTVRRGEVLVMTRNQAKSGLTVEEALEPNSVVMAKTRSPAFLSSGRVRMLIRDERDFRTFRALRYAFVKHGIDFGWYPWDEEVVVAGGSATGGITIPSQGRR